MNNEEENKIKLLSEATDILAKSDLLQKESIFNYNQIMKFGETVEKMNPDQMTDQEIMLLLKQGQTLIGRLKICAKELIKLDEQYENLRNRVNTFYGEELLPKHELPPLPSFDIFNDEGDEWKT
jgi:hypothetical protein